MTRRALVIGCTGFLGRTISAELASNGWEVVGVARKSADDFTYPVHEIDLVSQPIRGLLRDLAPELIVHAAGTASVAGSLVEPLNDFAQNVSACASLFDAVRHETHHTRLILLSSAAVYGNPASFPISESTPPNPISPYGYHKWLCEQLAQEYHRVYGLAICTLRIFSAYGAGLRRQVLWDICQKVFTEQYVELAGTGEETRDFIHAADIAAVVARLAGQSSAYDATPFNLASGQSVAIRSLAEMLIGELAPDTPLTFSGIRRLGDPMNWSADISRLKKLGVLSSSISLHEGIADYARWARAIHHEHGAR